MSKPGLPSLDDKLDEALKQTFPASDAFALFPEVSIAASVLNEPASGGAPQKKAGRSALAWRTSPLGKRKRLSC